MTAKLNTSQSGRVTCRVGWGGCDSDPRPLLPVPMPREIRESETPKAETPAPAPIKPRQRNQVPQPCSKWDLLIIAEREGRKALEAFALSEQKKRDDAATEQWRGYRLVRPAGCRYATHIQNPDGVRYRLVVTTEGVKTFEGCPDETFLSSLNAALRLCGSPIRVEGKKARVWHLRERAAWAGEIEWMGA